MTRTCPRKATLHLKNKNLVSAPPVEKLCNDYTVLPKYLIFGISVLTFLFYMADTQSTKYTVYALGCQFNSLALILTILY